MKKIALGIISIGLVLATSLCFAQKVSELRIIELPSHIVQIASLSSEKDDPDFYDETQNVISKDILVSQGQFDAKFHTVFEKKIKLTRWFYVGVKTTLSISMAIVNTGGGGQISVGDANSIKMEIVRRQNAALEVLKQRKLKESEYFVPERVRDMSVNGRLWAHYFTVGTIPLERFETQLDGGHALQITAFLAGNRTEFYDRSREIINEVMNSITITPKSK